MTEEERREMTRSNYAAQMEMLGYDASGNPLDDIVRVVRCRDCKYWEMPRTEYGIKCGYCNNIHSHVSSHRMTEENYYCPHGERRESE